MNRTFLLATAFLLTGPAAYALTSEQVIDDLSREGYTRIEVRNGLTQTKVEAIRGTQKLEVVYDRATGAVLKSETEAVEADDDTAPGISVRNRNRDFLRLSSRDDSDDDGETSDRSDDDDDSRDWSDDGDDDSRGRDDDDDTDRSDDDDKDDGRDDDRDDRGDDDRGDNDRGDNDRGDNDRGDSDGGERGGDDD